MPITDKKILVDANDDRIMGCPDRQRDFFKEPYCYYGTDKGWVYSEEESDWSKRFLHPCKWQLLTGGCPMGYMVDDGVEND